MTDPVSSAAAGTPEQRRIVMVTGASRGLGAAIAEALAGPDVQLVLLARTLGGLEALDDRIRAAGGSAALAPLDIVDDTALRRSFRALHDRWGRLDLLVHCAIHAPPLAPAGHIAEKDFDRALAVNVTATQRLILCAEPLLRAAGKGRAVFFDDARAGARFFGTYGATKAAQIALARSWQAESARIGPDIRLLSPRPMAGALRARFFPGEDREALARPRDEARRLLPELLGGSVRTGP